MRYSRRAVIRGWLVSGAGLLAGAGRLAAAPSECSEAGARLLALADFLNEGPEELNKATGEELDGRLYTDLRELNPPNKTTPIEHFYIRTRASRVLPKADQWRVQVDGLVRKAGSWAIRELISNAESMGVHLLECSGNNRTTRFGLLSVTSWAGVPLAKLIAKAELQKQATRVLISGFDEYVTASTSSIPGASWIFTLDEITERKAFLAIQMGGQPLTQDHGAPVRLLVPGWYGCASIKWVDRITLVDDSVAATSQMREFASRTQQDGVPQWAREYRPAAIEQAAMPIRVEKWLVAGKIRYKVVGICWGGSRPLKTLQVRFNPQEDYVPVQHFQQTSNDPWTLWTHDWTPKAPGTYLIHVGTKDDVPARRLNAGYYVREVEIDEV